MPSVISVFPSSMQACAHLREDAELPQRRIRGGTCSGGETRGDIAYGWDKNFLHRQSPETGKFQLTGVMQPTRTEVSSRGHFIRNSSHN